MKFPVMFTRYTSGAGTPVLGDDALLVDANGAPTKPQVGINDNFLSARITSINGWPLTRVALVAKYTGSGGAPVALSANMYVFEDNLQIYIPLPCSTSHTITPGTASAPTAPVYFDAMSLIDFPHVAADQQSVQPGTATFLCIIGGGTMPPAGRYDFILGAELTGNPF